MSVIHIHSGINNKLLHIIYKEDGMDEIDGRIDLTPANHALQVAVMYPEDSKKFKAHKHLEQHRPDGVVQESWLVTYGGITVRLFDTDDTLICTEDLEAGDCLVTLGGGHAFNTIGDATVWEFKTGPYNGPKADKEHIDEGTTV